MHELSVCRSMLAQVAEVALRHNATLVTAITVGVGPLSGVEPLLLQQAFTIARAGTQAADAALHIEALPLRVRCHACGAESDAKSNDLTCQACGAWTTHVISGDELMLMRVELEETHDV